MDGWMDGIMVIYMLKWKWNHDIGKVMDKLTIAAALTSITGDKIEKTNPSDSDLQPSGYKLPIVFFSSILEHV